MTTYKMFGSTNSPKKRDPDAKPMFDFVNGPDNQICCSCDHVILANVFPDQIIDIVLECPSCGELNVPAKSNEIPHQINIDAMPLFNQYGIGLQQDHLQAIGLLTLSWNALEYDFQQLIWAAANWDSKVGELTTLHMGNVSQVTLLKNLVRNLFGAHPKIIAESDSVAAIFDVLRASRNDIIHAAYMQSSTADNELEFFKRDAKKPTGASKVVTVTADKEHCLDLVRDISAARICAICLAKAFTVAHTDGTAPQCLAGGAETSQHISLLQSRLASLSKLRSGQGQPKPPQPSRE
ncbi:MAG: hypothetical protein ACXIVO_05060 [Glycocaulis sp.]